jgi:hypothetical protein
MSDSKTDSSASGPVNINTLLALLTIVGGIFVFSSQKLSTNRTSVQPTGTDQPLGDQMLERRLWQDPLARKNQETSNPRENSRFHELLSIAQESGTNEVWIMPVLISGGSFGEDQENRIRSRFAIVNALGQSGYVPDDAEHIGAVRTAWPSTQELKIWKKGGQLPDFWAARQCNSDTNSPATCSSNALCSSRELRFGYEWYRARQFHPGAARNHRRILVIWLPENSFEDDPLYRLVLFLRPFNERISSREGEALIRLIGPRRSSTLREMVKCPEDSSYSDAVARQIQCTLTNVALFTATASAIDEVLVANEPSGEPRNAVKKALEKKGFRSVQNLLATDSQLASQIVDELKLRGANPGDPKNHIVLISDWDTFYGRMLTLTYAAEMERNRTKRSLHDFITDYRRGTRSFPTNYHYFSYLLGMDGQGIEGDASERKASDYKSKPSTVSDLLQWVPESNKAESGAQFDYLSRLADRLWDLQYTVERNRGSIKAIGIAGSDIYDVLLILQALRPRFPNVLFFTTDLDARFLNPKERAWTQNLIVASSYGLELHPDLQRGVAPFRDSLQTAQYAAALAALGNTNLGPATPIPPRRFEIGRDKAVNLSTEPSRQIHPPALWEGPCLGFSTLWKIAGAIVAAFGLSLTLFFYFPSFRRILWDLKQHQAQLALYELGDLGDVEGVRFLLLRIARLRERDPLPAWTWKQFCAEAEVLPAPTSEDSQPVRNLEDWLKLSGSEQDTLAKSYTSPPDAYVESLCNVFYRLLNKIVRGEVAVPDEVIRESAFLSESDREKVQEWRRNEKAAGPYIPVAGLCQLRQRRKIIDKVLDVLGAPLQQMPLHLRPFLSDLSQPKEITTVSALGAASCSRVASLKLFDLRRRFTTLFWVVLGVGLLLMTLLGVEALRDTFWRPTGEPFNLTNGVSAWPTEFLRLLAFLLASFLLSRSYYVLRTAQYELTRKYRLPIGPVRFLWFRGQNSVSARNTELRADDLWRDYQLHAFFPNRMARAFKGLVLFLLFGFGMMAVSGYPLRPIRGDFLNTWDYVVLWSAIIGFLLLTFWTIHSATLAQWFVQQLSEAPTQYPEATRQHFSRERGNLHHTYIDEWIDVQLIADLTEAVGRLIYAPFILFFILLLSRNSWWDNWGWTFGLVAIFLANLVLASISVLILQRAARKAKDTAERTLEAKVRRLEAATAATPAQNNASQAQKLLEDIRQLKRGAFVPFWQNPLLAAILVPSGGTVLLEVILLLLHR